MAEREEIEINLKATADTSGAQQMAAALKQVQQAQQSTTSSGSTVSNVEYLRQVRESELNRARAQAQPSIQTQQQNVVQTQAQAQQTANIIGAAFSRLTANRNFQLPQYGPFPVDNQTLRAFQQQQFNGPFPLNASVLNSQQQQYGPFQQSAQALRSFQQQNQYGPFQQSAQTVNAFNQQNQYGPFPYRNQAAQNAAAQLYGYGATGGGGAGGAGGSGGGAGAAGGGSGGIFDRNTQSVIRFTAALAGLGVGLSIYYFAGRLLHQAIAAIVDDEKNAIQATINLNAAFGDSAHAYDNLARSISTGGQGSGFIFKASDVQQTIAGFKGLQDQFKLSQAQVSDLTVAATKLAAIHDIPLSDAAGALSQALSGSAGAADKLGLSLSDVTVQTQYANGQFAGAFQLLSPAEQAAARLAVAEQQVAQQSAAVGQNLNPLSEATRTLGANWENLNKSLGSPVLEAAATSVNALATALKTLNTLTDDLKNLPPIVQDIGKGMAVIAAINLTGPVGALTALAAALSKTNIGDAAKTVWDNATKAAQDYVKQAQQAVGQTGAGQAASTVAGKAAEAWNNAVKPVNQFKDAIGQAVNGQGASNQTSIIDQLGKKDKELAAANDQLTQSVQNYQKASEEVWTGLAQAAPAIQNQVNAFTGAVGNINNLTTAQRESLAIRQAELGALKEHQLQVAQTQQAEFGEVGAVKDLVDAYKNLIDAQGEVNRLQQEGVQLQGQLAQAQLNALTQTRAAQDEELRIQRDQLVASDRLISAQERAAGRRDIRQARIQQPDVQLRAFDASLPSIAIQRQEEVNQLLTRIAQATEAQAQQVIDLRITVNGAQVSTGTAG